LTELKFLVAGPSSTFLLPKTFSLSHFKDPTFKITMPTWSAENDLKVRSTDGRVVGSMKLTGLFMIQLATAIIALHQVKVSKDDCERLAAIIGDSELQECFCG
jgi:hypothetical protein